MILDGGPGDFEEAWKAFVLLEAVEWKHLPYTGGLMDQPDLLMRNIFRVKYLHGKLKELNKDAA